MKVKLLADQLASLDALAQITHAFGHLPAADINLSPITPDMVTISLHDDLHAFELWRAALGVCVDDVDYQQRPRSSHMTLKAVTAFAGSTVELVGYAAAMEPAGGAS